MKRILVLLLSLMILFTFVSCGDDGASYYIDYDGDGEMDKGEHVYDEDSDGTVHWDTDGDGWWDENDND